MNFVHSSAENSLCLISIVTKILFLLYLPSLTKCFESFTVSCGRVKYDRDTSQAINANRRGHWSELETSKPFQKTIENRKTEINFDQKPQAKS